MAMTTTFPVVFFESTHALRVVSTQPRLRHSVWTVDFVAASPSRDSQEYHRLMKETFGSTSDWTDEYRFDNASREIRSVILHVPEKPGDTSVAADWCTSPLITGGVVPEESEPFAIEPVDFRALTEDGGALVCTLAPRVTAPRWRLQISPELVLLFEGDQYAGWALWNPVSNLAPWDREMTQGCAAPAGTLAAIRELHQTITPEAVVALTNGEPGALARLRQLTLIVESLPVSPQRDALLRKVEEMLETFG